MKGLTYLNLILIVYLLLITEYTLPSGSCQPSDETHRGCPRRALGTSRGTAREIHGAVAGMGSGLPGAGQGRKDAHRAVGGRSLGQGRASTPATPLKVFQRVRDGARAPRRQPDRTAPPAHRGTSRVRARLFIPPWIQTLHHTQDDPSDAAGASAPAAPSGALMRRPPGSRPPAGSPGWGCRRAG